MGGKKSLQATKKLDQGETEVNPLLARVRSCSDFVTIWMPEAISSKNTLRVTCVPRCLCFFLPGYPKCLIDSSCRHY